MIRRIRRSHLSVVKETNDIQATVVTDEEKEEEERKAVQQQKLQAYFPDFPLDDWQLEAGAAILRGDNVIVCSPTGSGKTVVGELALLHAFYGKDGGGGSADDESTKDDGNDNGSSGSGIYTTPLKALSNQKYAELCKRFGKMNVGLSTGDMSINKGARITVMTTEVYRNQAWRYNSASSTSSESGIGGMAQGTNDNNNNNNNNNDLSNNAVVVLDEFHFMGDKGRGGVWEESVITSPPHTQIVALSATLSNGEALAAWMEQVTGRHTELVQVPGRKRPVPLRYLFATREGLFPLFRDPDAGPGAPHGLLGYRGEEDDRVEAARNDASAAGSTVSFSEKGFGAKIEEDDNISSGTNHRGKRPKGLEVNPALRAAARKRIQRVNRLLERQKIRRSLGAQDDFFDDGDSQDEGRWQRRRGGKPAYQSPRKLSPREERREKDRLTRNEMRKSVPSLSILLGRLRQKNLLPAIVFIFSRAGCDKAAQSVCQTMKGPSRDPTRALDIEIDQFGLEPKNNPTKNKKRKGRQRSQRSGKVVEDADGRTFRQGNNYVSESVLESYLDGFVSSLDDEAFDGGSPFSPSNWEFYSKAGLLEYTAVKDVATRIKLFNEDNPEIAFEDEIAEQFLFGVGSHHAGMLPAHKTFVELLYRNQLMKVVFATETLAAGINVPARTTCVCALAKRGDGSSMNLLATSNLLQMAGRAGRRGMDTDGTCVIVATPFESHEEAANILTDEIEPIRSQFRPSYSLSVNLIARGRGKLDVARQLVGKSFALWEKNRQGENGAQSGDESDNATPDSDVPLTVSQENFVDVLADVLQSQLGSERSSFDAPELQRLLAILNERELLKKTAKSYIAQVATLDLERTTLGYLEADYAIMKSQIDKSIDSNDLNGMAEDDANDLLEQVEIQRRITETAEETLATHPFETMSSVANSIMSVGSPEARVLEGALNMARGYDEPGKIAPLLPSELPTFAKAAVVGRRKPKRLQASAESTAVDAEDSSDTSLGDTWEEMMAIIKTLVAYGCLSTETPIFDESAEEYDQATYSVTPSGNDIGMLGYENSLWALVAMGGAWDVSGVTEHLDRFHADEAEEGMSNRLPKPQQEAETLVSLLRSMSPAELAGYVAGIVSESRESASGSLLQLFEELTATQQRVIQQALLVMERLTVVQRHYHANVGDGSAPSCTLDISVSEAVTAWADGCTWSEALIISGLPPGDLVRKLSRVLDAVRQLGNLPYRPLRRADMDAKPLTECRGIHPEVRRLCREAAKAINRYPVKDTLALEDIDDEDIEFVEDSEDDEVSESTAS